MASSFLKGLVTDYGKLGYRLWHRPLKMASLVYEREIGVSETFGTNVGHTSLKHNTHAQMCATFGKLSRTKSMSLTYRKKGQNVIVDD